MAIDESALTKGQIRKRNALCKSIGDKLGTAVFEKWLKEQPTQNATIRTDPVASKILSAMAPYAKDKAFKLGNKGYVIKRSKGRGPSGFVVEKGV